MTKGVVLAEWDPFNEPFVCEEEGVIRFTDIIDGKTVQEKVDDITRQASLTIMEYRTTNFRPSISICDEHGSVKKRSHGGTAAVYTLPVGSIIMALSGIALLALRRLSSPALRQLNSGQDWLILLLTFLPFATGLMARLDGGAYQTWMIAHAFNDVNSFATFWRRKKNTAHSKYNVLDFCVISHR